MLSLESVYFKRGERTVLSDIHLSLGQGEIVGVLGKNGAGKSTLASILSGLTSPSRGRVIYCGEEIASYPAHELSRRRAYLTQSVSEGLGLTVMDVLLMARYPHRPLNPVDYQVLDEVCESFQLWDFISRPLESLSGGERQKVMFAKSIAQISPLDRKNPSLLILDEPTASLDLEVQQKLLQTTHSLAKTYGLGVVLILHDLNQAAAYCDKLCVLYNGRLVLEGGPAEVLTEENLKKYFKVNAKVTFQNNLPMLTI